MSYPEETNRVHEWFSEFSNLGALTKKANEFMNYESSTLSLRNYKFPRSHNKDVDASTEPDSMGYFNGSVQTLACELAQETEYDYDKGEHVGNGVYKWMPIELDHLPEQLSPVGGIIYTGYLRTQFVLSEPKRVTPDTARITRLPDVWALPHSLQVTPAVSHAGHLWDKYKDTWTKGGIPMSIHEYDVFKDELGVFSEFTMLIGYTEKYFEPWKYGEDYFNAQEFADLMDDWLTLYTDSHHRAPDVTPYASLINRDDVDRLHEILNWLTPGGEDRYGNVREREPWRVSPGDCRCHPWIKQLRSVYLVEEWGDRGDDGHIQNELSGWNLVASRNLCSEGQYHDMVNSLTRNTTGDKFLYKT